MTKAPSAVNSSVKPKQSYFARVRHELENQRECLKDLEDEGGWDECDERFVAPALLERDGSLNMSLLFGFNVPPGSERRYILRQMERAREGFLDQILMTARKKKEEQRRVAEEAEDSKEMRALQARFAGMRARLQDKERSLQESLADAERRVAAEAAQRARAVEQRMWDEERHRVAVLHRRAKELPPDFPTTFSACTRLHPSPARRAAAAASSVAETPPAGVAAGSAAALASARRPQRFRDAAQSPLVRIDYQVDRDGTLLPVTDAAGDL